MADYTITNLEEVEDAAVGFGLSPALEARFQAEILQGLVDFRLLQAYFKDSPNRATEEQVGAAMESRAQALVATHLSRDAGIANE